MVIKSLFQHSRYLTPEIQAIVKPLSRSLGIEHFGYLRIYKDSTYYYLSNDLGVSQNYIEKVSHSHIYCDRVLLKDPHSELKILSWPSQPTEESMEIYFNRGFWEGHSIINHGNPDYIEIWWVAPNVKNSTPRNDYLGFMEFIIGFVKYFDQKLISQINFSNEILGKYSGGFEFNLCKVNEFEDRISEMRALITTIFPKGFEVKCKNGLVRLSPRQTECLRLLANGKSTKEISRDLALSGRTVEKHIQAIHEKLGYSLRSDLVKAFNEQLSYFQF